MIIKKWSSVASQWEEQYPKTIHTELYDANAVTTRIFNDANKIKEQYLPDSIYGGLEFVGAVSYNTANAGNLETLIIGGASGWTLSSTLDAYTGKSYANDDYDDIGQKYIGHYWVVGGTSRLDVVDATLDNEADFRAGALDDGIPKIGQAPFTISVEPGDWLVITGWDNTNKTFTFNIINNTYQDASTSNKGVVEFADSTEIAAGTSTNRVMSVADLVSKFAIINHTHDDDEITINNAYANIGSSASDALSDVLTDINSVLGTQATTLSTHTTDISNLQGRKEVFVQVSAPTANQANDIWFDI